MLLHLAGDLFAPVNSDYITIPWILNSFCVIWKTRGGPINLFKFIHYELLNVNSRASAPTLKKHWWARVLPLSFSLDVSYKCENPWDFQKTWPLTFITRLRSLRCICGINLKFLGLIILELSCLRLDLWDLNSLLIFNRCVCGFNLIIHEILCSQSRSPTPPTPPRGVLTIPRQPFMPREKTVL